MLIVMLWAIIKQRFQKILKIVNYISKSYKVIFSIHPRTKKEIYKAVKVKTFNFPQDLKKFDCLIVTVDHKQFKIQKKVLEKYLKKCKLIIDHDGAWKKYNLKNNYHLSGDRGWI